MAPNFAVESVKKMIRFPHTPVLVAQLSAISEAVASSTLICAGDYAPPFLLDVPDGQPPSMLLRKFLDFYIVRWGDEFMAFALDRDVPKLVRFFCSLSCVLYVSAGHRRVNARTLLLFLVHTAMLESCRKVTISFSSSFYSLGFYLRIDSWWCTSN